MNRHGIIRPRGFMAADVLAAFALLIVVGAALMVAVSRQRLGATRLADTREAARLAEEGLVDLQSGLPVPQDAAETKTVVRPIAGGAPIANHHWTEVQATVRGQTRIIVGLVPDNSTPTTRPSEGLR